MERPRIFLDTKATSQQTYQELLATKISANCKGVSFFVLVLHPHASAQYKITVAKLLTCNDIELKEPACLMELPHLTNGVYDGVNPTDDIVIQQKSKDGTEVKTTVSLQFNEVVAPPRPPCPE